MRPTTAEFLRAFKYNLDTTIIPDLSSAWPRQTAVLISGLMQYLINLEERGPSILEEDNARLRGVLEEIQRDMAATPGTETSVAQLRQILAATSNPPSHVCHESLVADNAQLQSALESLLPILEQPENVPFLVRARSVLLARLETDLNALTLPLLQIVRGS